MRYSNERCVRRQFDFLRRQFLQEGDLPFTDVLSEPSIAPALDAIKLPWKDRIYTPLVTLWVFLGQVLSADHSCRGAVARLIAHRLSQGQAACSAKTGAYCQARKRLPEMFCYWVACLVGRRLNEQAHPSWLWKGRRVYMFDGTTVMMPDTPANQAAYPQVSNQKPGVGFPIARIGTIMSLSCGAIVDVAICRYAGKWQGEISMLRLMWNLFRPGDVLLTDRLMCSWTELAQLQQRGVDSVTRLNKRQADFRRGKRLGKGDHIVQWSKPDTRRSVSLKVFRRLPKKLEVREVHVRVTQPGFRTKEIVVVTTILEPKVASKEDLASLYRSRWTQELDIRDIKSSLRMDFLRCKSPDLVRKEIWTHLLAYNLIRTVMAQAADRHGLHPRTISFKGALQTLEAFQPLVDFQSDRGRTIRLQFYRQLLQAIASHRVANRPDRFEPRKVKRRYRKADLMTKPRWEYKELMLQGVTKI